jgi:hypothetical protein
MSRQRGRSGNNGKAARCSRVELGMVCITQLRLGVVDLERRLLFWRRIGYVPTMN